MTKPIHGEPTKCHPHCIMCNGRGWGMAIGNLQRVYCKTPIFEQPHFPPMGG